MPELVLPAGLPLLPRTEPAPARLLFVSHSFPPAGRPLANVGGMQRVATELYAALGREPAVALSGEILHTSWKWTHARMPLFLARVAHRLADAARTGAFDTVLFSSMVTAALAVPLQHKLRRAGIRTAAIAHGLDVTTPFGPYQQFVTRVFGALDLVLPVSTATGEACLARGLAPEKLRVVPNGIDVTRFAPPADRLVARRHLLALFEEIVPADALLLCSVGRHVPRKGFAWFAAEVMPRLPDNVYWFLAGEGPETDAVRQAAARQGLADRVRLLGRVSDADLHALYQGADLFVMPNRPVAGDMEGFGVVMLEAGLAGMPTIGAGIEGIRDVVAEGVSGHLLPSGDADAFARLLAYYQSDRDALARLSASTAAHVPATFSWPAIAHRYAEVLAAAHPADGVLTV